MTPHDVAKEMSALALIPGDLLRIRLVNTLEVTDPGAAAAAAAAGATEFHLSEPNTTNLHTHGLHVSGEGIADNVFEVVVPGAERQFEYPIHAAHTLGLMWYHPHAHGTARGQMAEGMAAGAYTRSIFSSI
jgi:FtsP/CotA-like multicopper oxidase with cupredoxin domain